MYKYIHSHKNIKAPEQTIAKAIKLLPELFNLLDKYEAYIPGDSEQEVSSIIIDDFIFGWLGNRNEVDVIRVATVNYGYLVGKLIND